MKFKTTRLDFRGVLKQCKAILKRSIRSGAAYARKVAMNSMEETAGPSAPGTAPHAHPRTSKKGKKLKTFKNFIVFAAETGFDGFERSFVGPKTRHWAEEIGHTHEFGGTAEKRVKMTFTRKKGARKRDAAGRFVKNGRPAKTVVTFMKTQKYPKRPFMRPALVKTTSRFSQLAGRSGE